MRHELFIDNKKVDLSLSTNINLTYKSNLLSELDKITSSYSYTIKLPKTKRNMELIEGCNIPSNNSSFAYLPHRARLLRDGIEIVSDAVVVLLSVGSDIQISLTWGNVSVLADFLSIDDTLKDLDLGSITWTKNQTINTPKANYGNGNIFYQPVVKNSAIIQGIKNKYNLSIEIPSSDLYNKLVLPCLSSVGVIGEIISAKKTLYLKEYNVGYQDYDEVVWYYIKDGEGSDYFEFEKYDGHENSYNKFTLKDKSLSMRIKGKVTIEQNGNSNIPGETKPVPVFSSFPLKIVGLYNNIKIPYSQVDTLPVINRYTYNIDVTINGSDIKDDFIELKSPGSSASYINTSPYNIQLEITPIDNTETVQTPDKGDVLFTYSVNVSEISIIDFLKAIMSMMGWYAEPMEGDSGIRMLPYSTITDNKSKAVDWSDKLVNRRIEPSDIEFRMSGMAQKNYFRYEKDDTVTGDYDSYITVDDKTLDTWKDAVTLPFAATDTVGVVPSIPLYSYNEKGEMEINSSLVPRILIQEGTTLKFDGLQWNKLIQANWGAYQDIIRRPKILTEQVRLNAIDLKLIDMTIPVYISQYGSFFAIIEIKTKKDDICDVQLLKI